MASGFTHEKTKNKSVEWYTPAWVFDKLGLAFDLDPCSPLDGPLPWVPAASRYTIEDNGLTSPWFGRVWLNPPYGRDIWRWLQRMHLHRDVCTGVSLVFARTDPDWFHQYIRHADGILFLKKRVHFVDREGNESGSPGSGSMLVSWGKTETERLHSIRDLGVFVRPNLEL